MSKTRFMSLRLVWLEALVTVDEAGSFVAASHSLGCSQSMVGRYIRQLEEWYGQQLVVRTDGAVLTTEGKALAKISKRALELLDVWNVQREWKRQLDGPDIGQALRERVRAGLRKHNDDDEVVDANFLEVNDD